MQFAALHNWRSVIGWGNSFTFSSSSVNLCVCHTLLCAIGRRSSTHHSLFSSHRMCASTGQSTEHRIGDGTHKSTRMVGCRRQTDYFIWRLLSESSVAQNIVWAFIHQINSNKFATTENLIQNENLIHAEILGFCNCKMQNEKYKISISFESILNNN